MVLYIIGLGLGNEKDITIRGLEAIKSSCKVFLECYTSILSVDKEKLEAFYGKSITIADRNFVECQAEEIYGSASGDNNVSLLVVGDPVCATTHTDIILRAIELDIDVKVIHNASVMGAVGSCGLQLYNFGQTISIPYYEPNWRPTSFYNKIKYNRMGGMHTLCLLDIKVKEPNYEAMAAGKTRQLKYLPPRYMTVNVACEQLIEAETDVEQKNAYQPDKTLCVGMARLGDMETQTIIAGTLQELKQEDFGAPLHCLVICGQVHDLELEFLKRFLVKDSTFEPNDHLTVKKEEETIVEREDKD